MQTVSSAWTKAYNEGYVLKLKPRLYVDWNYNRFASSVTASNDSTTDQADDLTVDPPVLVMNPIASIVQHNRPAAGIIKARAGQGKTKSVDTGQVSYRVADNNSKYRYWISPVVSSSTGSGSYSIANTSPKVIYGSSVNTNKIVIGVENSLASPVAYTVQITTNGTTWSTIATNPALDSNGRIILYPQFGGSWSSTPNLSNPQSIRGIKLNVTSISRAKTRFSLIEIAAHYRVDVSNDVVSVDFEKAMSDVDQILPVGVINSDTITFTLDNTTRNYDIENPSGPYYGLLDKNAEMICSLGLDTTDYTGSGFEYLPFGTWYADSWGQSTDDATVSVQATDFSKFLQEEACPNMLFTGRTPSQIIRNLLYAAGHNNFSVDSSTDEVEPVMNFCWFSKEKTIWEAISSVCKSQQTVFYIDENNQMRYRTKDHLYDAAVGSPVYAISAVPSGATLSNLESVDQEFAIEANKVSVFYKNTYANTKSVNAYRQAPLNQSELRKFQNYIREVPITSVLWTPTETVALQAGDLRYSMTDVQTWLYIDTETAKTYAYKGLANIEGEIVSWDGKQYKIFKNGVALYKTVRSYSDKVYWDLHSDAKTVTSNAYTGALLNVKRGLMGSVPAAHAVDIAGWSGYLRRANNTVISANTRLSQARSQIILHGNTSDTTTGYVKALRGTTSDQYKVYGARVRFAAGSYTQGLGGIVMHSQSNNVGGYFIEFGLTEYMTKYSGGTFKEIRAYRMSSGGVFTKLSSSPNGVAYTIVKDQWIDVEITYDVAAHRFIVYVDGRQVLSWVDTTYTTGKWGVYNRGDSLFAAEYFYVVKDLSALIPRIDNSSFQNKISGGFESGYKDREIFLIRKHVQSGKMDRSYLTLGYIFDDFGPIVHEVREFKVDHAKTPALSRHIYCSNEWDAYVLEYRGSPFDSTFLIANAGRDVSVLHGDDATIYVGQNVRQQLFVYGQQVVQDEPTKVTVQDDDSIRKRGVVELQFESDWIQSEAQAKNLANFIKTHWGEPVDNVTVTGFFNPAIQVGDYVTVNYPERSMSPSTHKYHVVSVTGSVSNGLEISLKLRRIR